MKFTPAQYAKALYEAVTETAAKDHEKVMDNFAQILAHNGDLDKYQEIEREYMVLEMEATGKKHADVITARDTELSKNVVDTLNNAVDEDIIIKKKVDENLVGGLIMRVGDKLIDGSVKAQLENLNRSLKE